MNQTQFRGRVPKKRRNMDKYKIIYEGSKLLEIKIYCGISYR